MFDIRDAEIIHEVARSGGFRAAAQKLNLSQSAVSTRITGLEERLGIVIFDRRHRGTRPTPIGRAFLDQTARLIAMRDEILSQLSPDLDFAGTVRIGVVETVVHTWLAAMLSRLRSMIGIRFELSVDTSPVMARKLLADEIDVAFMMSDLVPDRAVSALIYACEIAYFAAPTMELPKGVLGLAELVRYPIVTFPKGTIPYEGFEKLLSGTSLSVPLLHGCASLSTTLHLVQDGFGIGLLPVPMTEKEVAAGRLLRIDVATEAKVADLSFSVSYMPAQQKALMDGIKAAAAAAIVDVW